MVSYLAHFFGREVSYLSFYRIKYMPFCKTRYTHMYFTRRRGRPGDSGSKILEALDEAEKSSQNLARARRNVEEIILCNQFDYFCTFTFSEEKVDRYDFKKCRAKLTNFFKNYRVRCSPEFRYIIIPEFHKDGAVHFHGMVKGIRPEDFEIPVMILKRNKRNDKLELVSNTKEYIRWKQYTLGFFSCSLIRKYDACARYVSKYITKDLMRLPLGQRVYMCSEGLSRAELIFDEDNVPLMFNPEFENEFVKIKRSDSTFDILDEYWMEGGDLNYDDELDLPEDEIFFPRMDGEQLALYYVRRK